MPRETDGNGNFKIYTFVLRHEWLCSVTKRFVDYEVGEDWARRTTLELESATNYKFKKEISFEWVHKGQFRIMKEGNVELLGIDYDEDDGFDGCADDPLNRKW